MGSDQAALLIDDTLALMRSRMLALETSARMSERGAIAAEYREWLTPAGNTIDLLVFPGLAGI